MPLPIGPIHSYLAGEEGVNGLDATLENCSSFAYPFSLLSMGSARGLRGCLAATRVPHGAQATEIGDRGWRVLHGPREIPLLFDEIAEVRPADGHGLDGHGLILSTAR